VCSAPPIFTGIQLRGKLNIKPVIRHFQTVLDRTSPDLILLRSVVVWCRSGSDVYYL
jgi:hypothetical protein